MDVEAEVLSTPPPTSRPRSASRNLRKERSDYYYLITVLDETTGEGIVEGNFLRALKQEEVEEERCRDFLFRFGLSQ